MRKAFLTIILICLFFSSNSYSQGDSYREFVNYERIFDSLLKKYEYSKLPKLIEESDRLAKVLSEDSITVRVFEMNSKYYYYTSNYDNAAYYLIETAKLYEKLGRLKKSLNMYNNLSNILSRNKQYKEVIDIRLKILKFAERNKDSFLLALTYTNLGPAYRRVNNLDSCYIYLDKAISVSKKYRIKNLIAANYKNYQKTYLDIGEYEKSLIYADSIERFYKEDMDRDLYENTLSFSAQALYQLKKYDLSIEKCNEAISLIEKSGHSVSLSMPYELLSLNYEDKGQYKKAYEYKNRYYAIKDSIFSQDKQKTILSLEKKFQNEKKEKENLQLKQESAVKDLTISNKNNTILWSFLSFVTILFLLITYQLRKSKKTNVDLQNAINEQTKLEKELTSVRNNIAQDFHDDLGNKLARISIFSQLLSKNLKPEHDKEKTMLSHISTDTNYLYKGTRDFIFSLKSESDYAEELITYLSDFGEDYFKEFEVDFEIEKYIDVNKKLPYYWSKQLVYIFKEAMTNAAKHAKASKINLVFRLEKHRLEIKCVDNGMGFSIDDLKSKNGLLNMEQRAKKINGTLEMKSANNCTTITFVGDTRLKKQA